MDELSIDEMRPDSTVLDEPCTDTNFNGLMNEQSEVTTHLLQPLIPEGMEHGQATMCDSSNNPIQGYSLVHSNLSTGLLPSVAEFAGDLAFELFLDPSEISRKKWLYSEKLRKIFIDINRFMIIHFKWDYMRALRTNLFIRALPVYTQDDWLHIPVERCPVHIALGDNLNAGFPWVDHVLRCENNGTRYELDDISKRRSCITPVSRPAQANIEYCKLEYKFVCKTSCYRGMQRRPIVVVFTLEDENGTVLGRRCLTFKICSCLKRDKQREEEEWDKNNKDNNSESDGKVKCTTVPSESNENFPKVIKREPESNDNTDNKYHLEIEGLTRENFALALTTMHNALLGETVRNKFQDTQPLIQQIEDLLQSFKTTPDSNDEE